MSFDVSYLAFWLLLAMVVGAFVGWRNETPGPQEPWFEGWFKNAVIALAVGFVVSIIHLFSGRLAFWVETATLFFAAYLVGCLVGGAARRTRVDA